ncbi:MAG TPA: hypothetical protein VIG36_14750 [Methylocystis sp.]|jgi:hypothetical protein
MTDDAPPDRPPRWAPCERCEPIYDLAPVPNYDQVWSAHVERNWQRRGLPPEEEQLEARRRRRSLRRVS